MWSNKFLFVGDMHVKKDNIAESKRLIQWIAGLQVEYKNIPVVFAGDQYNDFGIARVEVVDFWRWAYSLFSASTYSLVGNHDMNPDGSLNFMVSHSDQTNVIDKLTVVDDKIVMMPFYRDNEKFIEDINTKAPVNSIVICHQEFNGAQYENGFYAPHGVELDKAPNVSMFVSGHIHKSQRFGRVWYPGTPRMLTRSDVGEDKGVWLIDLDQQQFNFIPTPVDICEPFQVFTINPGDKIPKELKNASSSKIYVDVKGDEKFVKDIIRKLPDTVKVRSLIESEISVSVKESEGVGKAFATYLDTYFNSSGINISTDIRQAVVSSIYEKCPFLRNV